MFPKENPHYEKYEQFVESLQAQIDKELEEIYATIGNEHKWELGYDGKEPNPHTQNIKWLKQYERKLEIMYSLLEATK